MPMHYQDLSPAVRLLMSEELSPDCDSSSVYISNRLSGAGKKQWPVLLSEAIQDRDDLWLANQLRARTLLNATEERRHKSGKVTSASVPHTAPDTLSEGEFNRYYIRGLCRFATESDKTTVEVYRAKEVANPRSASVSLIGMLVDPEQLFSDLRENAGVDLSLGLPPGPNSGLSAKLGN